MDWRGFTTGLVAASLLAAGARAGGKAKRELASNEMAVEIYYGYLAVARGSVNGLGNLRFLLDTGATDTAIDRSVAEKLGLWSEPTKVTTFDRTVKSEWAQVREITFGPERASNVRVMIEDLRYLGSLGTRVDGVIALDQLRRQSFVVDYGKECVTFSSEAQADMRSAPMLVDGNAIRVEAELDGRSVWMAADTGAPGTVLYEDTLKNLAVNYRLEGGTDWLSLGGHVESHIAAVPRFRMGGEDLRREVILVSVPEAKRVKGVSGYLGLPSLGAKEVAFDFERNQLRWRK